MNQYNPDLDEYYDMTDDEGFCHLGEREEGAYGSTLIYRR